MDLHGYIDRIESNVEDPVALEGIRAEAVADGTLSTEDKVFIQERVGTYLADLQRQRGPLDLDSPDLEGDEDAGET